MLTVLDLKAICDASGLSAAEAMDSEEIIVNAFDHRHTILFWNKGAEKYFGIAADVATGQRLEDLLPEAKKDERTGWIDRCLQGQEILLLNGQYQRKKGKYELRLVPAKDADGNICAAVNIVRPCT